MQRLNRIADRLHFSSLHRMVAGTLLVQGAMLVFSSVASILISRALGTDGRGIISWLFAYCGLGMMFSLMGICQALKKYIALKPEQTPVFILLSFLFLGGSLLVFLPLFYWYGQTLPIPQQYPFLFNVSLVLVIPISVAALQNNILIGVGRNLHLNILLVVEKLVLVGLTLGFLFMGWITPLTAILINIASAICRVAVGAVYIRPYFKRSDFFPSFAQLGDAFRLMRRLLMSAYFANMAMYYTSAFLTLMLGIALSATELGYFSVAKLLADVVLMIPMTLGSYTTPYIVKEHAAGRFVHAERHVILLAFIGMTIIVSPFLFFSGPIIHLLFGPSFAAASKPLQIMAVGIIAGSVVTVAQSIIIAYHRDWMLILNSGILALCVTVLTLMYFSDLSAETAAYIYSATYIVGMIISLIIVVILLRTDKAALTGSA